MHVIARPALIAFWRRYPDAQAPLSAWFRLMQSMECASLHELREVFPGADHVDGLTVFNIGGNKYRLVAAMHYNRQKVYVRGVFTHSEYDRGKWRKPT